MSFRLSILRPRGHPKSTKSGFGSQKFTGINFGANVMSSWMLLGCFLEAFFKDLRAEASSVRIAIGPFVKATNVVEEPDGYVNKLVTTALRK